MWVRVLCGIGLMALFAFSSVDAQAARRECKMDLVFLIDSSGSICDNDDTKTTTRVDGRRQTNCKNWELVLAFAAAIVHGLEVGPNDAKVAAVLFANRGSLLWDLDEYDNEGDLEDAIVNIKYTGGNTNTSGGIKIARQDVLTSAGGDRDGVLNVVIIIADGISTRDKDKTVPQANSLKKEGAVVFVIGVTDQIDEAELKAMSSDPQEKNKNYFTQTDFDQLGPIISTLINLTCSEVEDTSTTSTTTTTTTRRPPRPGCNNEVDVVFVVDSSGSIRNKNFVYIRQFLYNMLETLSVDSGNAQVGLIQFSTNVERRFLMSDGLSLNDMQEVVENMPYLRGTTNTAEALDYVVDTMFTSRNGNRGNVPDVLVVMTDGNSNDKDATVTAALRVKSSGIHIITVQMGAWVDQTELKAISSHPWETNLIEVEDFDGLDRIQTTLRDFICNNVDECSSNPCRNRGTCVDGVGRFWCICRDNWGGSRCEYNCREPADVVFALDASGSIGKNNFEAIVRFAQDVVEELPIDGEARVGLESFAGQSQIYFYLNTHNNRQAILNAMSLPYYLGGTTNIAGAFTTMRESMFVSNRGDRSNYPNVGVTITDGRHPDDPAAAKNEAKENRDQDIDMLAVAIGSFQKNNYLRDISSYPIDNNIFSISSVADLTDIMENLRDTICNAEDECESDPCENGGDCVDERNGYHCECLDQFTGINCERGCNGQADIILMVDNSGSIRSKRFLVVKEFFVNLLNELEIFGDKVRVGALSFATNSKVEFHLNAFSSKLEIIQGVRSIPYTGGRTNIAAGLEMAREEMFQSNRGDRQDVPNYLIMFTDGQANEREDETIPQAVTTRISGVHIMSVGVGTGVDRRELLAIASDPAAENTFSVDSFNDLNDIADGLLMAFCNEVDSCDARPCDRGTCVDGLNKYTCQCPSGYTGRDCSRRCNEQMDLVLILDFSGSVDETHDVIISLAQQIVYGVDLRQDRTRVGVITYSTEARVNFYLETYSEQKDILNALSFGKSGGRTNTQAALELARTELFNSGNGDRRSASNKVILMTDGGSNIEPENTIPEATRLKDDDNADIFVVAIGDKVDMSEINAMASSSTAPFVTRLENQNDVADVADEILDELCG